MKNIIFTFAAILLFASNFSASAQANLADFVGMAGCWERRDDAKKLFISEQWMLPAGTSILGMGRTVKNEKTTGWEFMRIESREGGLYFVSRPKENAEDTAFKLISSTAGKFVFENKTHDFPQRVSYRVEKNKLLGRIEGNNNGKSLKIDFPMERVKCES